MEGGGSISRLVFLEQLNDQVLTFVAYQHEFGERSGIGQRVLLCFNYTILKKILVETTRKEETEEFSADMVFILFEEKTVTSLSQFTSNLPENLFFTHLNSGDICPPPPSFVCGSFSHPLTSFLLATLNSPTNSLTRNKGFKYLDT